MTEPLSESELCPPSLLSGQEEAFARDVERLRQRAREFVAVACPACGADEPEPGLEKWGFTWARCPRCRTLYMTPRPSPEVMGAYYAASENYAYWAEHIFPASEAATATCLILISWYFSAPWSDWITFRSAASSACGACWGPGLPPPYRPVFTRQRSHRRYRR